MSDRALIGIALANTRADELLAAVRIADEGGVDLVVIDDAFDSPDADRLDALLVAARLGPTTRSIGLVPTVTVTHTEPFHVAKNIATLDWVSRGRAGWRPAVSTAKREADLFGRKDPAPPDALAREAVDAVEVARRLWDSWEDGAIIRDRATGRYIDRDRVHYIDFEGEFFSVRGPSIVPRSPQGQPLVFADADDAALGGVVAQHADVVIVPNLDVAHAVRQATTRDARILLRADRPQQHDGADGVLIRLEPGDVRRFVDALGSTARPQTLRERFGFTRPANRYAASSR